MRIIYNIHEMENKYKPIIHLLEIKNISKSISK